MVPREAALWERVLQCVALGDGQALNAHFNRLLPVRDRHKRIGEVLT